MPDTIKLYWTKKAILPDERAEAQFDLLENRVIVGAHEFGATQPAAVDLCIVGAGAAGLAMAWRLREAGLKIAMLESGGTQTAPNAPDESADALNAGISNLSDYPFQSSRARGIGGTTALWTGACVPLNAEDFEKRDWVPYSGWPIRYNDLATYYKDAAPLFDLVEPPSNAHLLAQSPFDGGDLEAKYAQIMQKRHFAKRHADWITRSKSLTVITGATVAGFLMTAGGKAVNGVRFCSPDGVAHSLNARTTVLACGGIEAPRLLLSAQQDVAAALGPAMENVGRFHMEHPIKSLGIVKIPSARDHVAAFTNMQPTEGAALLGIFSLSPRTRAKAELLNVQFHTYRYHAFERDPAVMALKKLANPNAPSQSDMASIAGPRQLARVARYVGWHYWNKASRKAPFDHVRLQAFVEQEPDPHNRITLSDKTDRFGQRLPHLCLTESDRLKDSITRTLDIMAKSLADRGYPDVVVDQNKLRHLEHYGGYGLHHMGGTRMSDDPASGVVDKNCKVHGLGGLYVASSSVFPTGGAANPTLTICALALRLSDHLVNELK